MPERDHHEASDDDVHGKGRRHLFDRGTEPVSEFLDGAALPLVPVRVGLGVVGALHCVDDLVSVVASPPEVGGCHDLHDEDDEDVEDQEDGGGKEGIFEGKQGVHRIRGRGGHGGVDRVGPSVEVRPQYGLIKAKEGHFVIRANDEPLVDILLTNSKGYLLPPPMMEEREQTQAGDEHCDDRENSPQCCKGSPDKYENF